MGNNLIDDRSRRTVPTPVSVSRLLWEEANMMPFRNDDDGNFGVDLEFHASSCVNR